MFSSFLEMTSSSNFFSQRKKITKRKKSEADVHNGNTNTPSESVHSHMKSLPVKQVFTKPISGKGNVLLKKAKKPPAPRKPPIKKEKEISKPPSDKNVVNPQIIRNYDINNVQIVNEEQG